MSPRLAYAAKKTEVVSEGISCLYLCAIVHKNALHELKALYHLDTLWSKCRGFKDIGYKYHAQRARWFPTPFLLSLSLSLFLTPFSRLFTEGLAWYMQLPVDNPQSTLLTLHDAITDSPVYRSTTLHFDDQLDLLEKWLESLSKYMKLYVNQLNSKLGTAWSEKSDINLVWPHRIQPGNQHTV